MRIFLTGGTGFIGSALLAALLDRGHDVVAMVRNPLSQVDARAVRVSAGELTPELDLSRYLRGQQVVVHAAARVHVMHETVADSLAAYRRSNTQATLALARQAAAAGVQRFVFVSSIKVSGETSASGRPLTADCTPAPRDAYGVSKREAEDGLRDVAHESGMEVVVVRPPLVYGPGVRANFATMMRWLQRGLPLPLGSVTENRRSLVALDNLTDLLVLCIFHPAAANETFLVSDGEDISTAALLRRLATAMGRPPRLFPVPLACLRAAFILSGRHSLLERILGSLQVDISKTRSLLGWNPPLGLDEGLRRAASGLEK